MKIRKQFLAILLSFCCFVLTGCFDVDSFLYKVFYNGYSKEEIAIIHDVFDSFQNSKNFVIQDDNTITLVDKKAHANDPVNDWFYNDKKIDSLLGCADEYFYVSYSIARERTYTLHIIQVDYDTLEMKEIMQIENSSRFPYSFCKDGKIYIYNEENYYIYDIASGEKESFSITSRDEFFAMRKESKYSFDIEEKKITITCSETKEKKVVSFEKDLEGFEEGVYIKEVNANLERSYFRFKTAVEKEGTCYLLGILPFTWNEIDSRAIIFTYNFESEELSYYSSCPYAEYYRSTNLIIIDR